MKDIDYMEAEMAQHNPFADPQLVEAHRLGWRGAMRAAHAKVNAENAALRTALADAISSPMGVVPASADQFYDATKGMVKP